jgi:tetratricopeptide (TPR) repeat protein
MSYHPVKFIVLNHRYAYIYHNQLVGGLKGAYGNYETDYYYVSQTEASEWLQNYIRDKKDLRSIKIKATYSVSWLFRKFPEIQTSYFRYEERSMSDWDYAIVVNRYIPPFQLKNNIWPPGNRIHVIYADKIPVCAVLERRTKDDLNGYIAINEGRNEDAIRYFKKALKVDDTDEMIFYNFATALYNSGKYQEADSALKAGLRINPDFQPILMYLGNIAMSQNRPDDAIGYYEKVIKADRKYFEGYVNLAGLLAEKDMKKARDLLRTCLTMNPSFKPAVIALADTYRTSDPDIAKKYDDLANRLK